MRVYHEKSRFRKAKGNKSPGVFGTYLALVAKKLPNDRRKSLLDSNAPLSQYTENENQILRKLAESMAYGLVGPCPQCNSWNLKHQFKLRQFRCLGGGKDTKDKSECDYSSAEPPRRAFTVSEEFHDIDFLKDYKFEERDKIAGSEINESGRDRGYPQRKEGYVMAEKSNEMFEKYYQGQGLMPESEWQEFLDVLRAPLPCTFRVTGYKTQAQELLKVIKSDYFTALSDVHIDGKKIDPPKCLSWYPDSLAWQLNLERNVIRHHELLARLKQFLVTETESGHISRQEAVSMIPPLVLDIQPHHKVLDMCAAPGSKTAQLVEALHAKEDKVPEGFVVANDADNKRCYLMVHQVKRLESPCYTITNHDASQLPGFRVDTEKGSDLLKFDRVLADVPCSGDGTFRKNVDAWPKWNSAAGHSLHPLQSRILRRGLDVLEEGGRLVYSTCSLNPIEDEAVLTNVISSYDGTVELLDVTAELPGLRYTPGRASWRVMGRTGDWYETMDDVPEKLGTQIFPSMFPPSAEVAEQLHLDRSMRILPHFQDTGGFFIAVIKKVEHPKTRLRRLRAQAEAVAVEEGSKDAEESPEIKVAEVEKEESAEGSVDSENSRSDGADNGKRRDKRQNGDPDNPPPLKKQKLRGYKEDPFVFLSKDAECWPSIKEFYGISDDYPVDQLMIRCNEGKGRNLYFVSAGVRQLVQANDQKIRFINHGLRVLNKSPCKYCSCDYRLVQEGIEHFYPYMTKRLVRATRDDFVTLLTGEAPFIRQLSPRLQQQLHQLDEQGSIVYVYDPKDEGNAGDSDPGCAMAVTGWKGLTSARTFLPKHDRAHYLRLCGVEFSGVITLIEKKQKQNAEDAKENEGLEELIEEDDSKVDAGDNDSQDSESKQDILNDSEVNTGDVQDSEAQETAGS